MWKFIYRLVKPKIAMCKFVIYATAADQKSQSYDQLLLSKTTRLCEPFLFKNQIDQFKVVNLTCKL